MQPDTSGCLWQPQESYNTVVLTMLSARVLEQIHNALPSHTDPWTWKLDFAPDISRVLCPARHSVRVTVDCPKKPRLEVLIVIHTGHKKPDFQPVHPPQPQHICVSAVLFVSEDTFLLHSHQLLMYLCETANSNILPMPQLLTNIRSPGRTDYDIQLLREGLQWESTSTKYFMPPINTPPVTKKLPPQYTPPPRPVAQERSPNKEAMRAWQRQYGCCQYCSLFLHPPSGERVGLVSKYFLGAQETEYAEHIYSIEHLAGAGILTASLFAPDPLVLLCSDCRQTITNVLPRSTQTVLTNTQHTHESMFEYLQVRTGMSDMVFVAMSIIPSTIPPQTPRFSETYDAVVVASNMRTSVTHHLLLSPVVAQKFKSANPVPTPPHSGPHYLWDPFVDPSDYDCASSHDMERAGHGVLPHKSLASITGHAFHNKNIAVEMINILQKTGQKSIDVVPTEVNMKKKPQQKNINQTRRGMMIKTPTLIKNKARAGNITKIQQKTDNDLNTRTDNWFVCDSYNHTHTIPFATQWILCHHECNRHEHQTQDTITHKLTPNTPHNTIAEIHAPSTMFHVCALIATADLEEDNSDREDSEDSVSSDDDVSSVTGHSPCTESDEEGSDSSAIKSPPPNEPKKINENVKFSTHTDKKEPMLQVILPIMLDWEDFDRAAPDRREWFYALHSGSHKHKQTTPTTTSLRPPVGTKYCRVYRRTPINPVQTTRPQFVSPQANALSDMLACMVDKLTDNVGLKIQVRRATTTAEYAALLNVMGTIVYWDLRYTIPVHVSLETFLYFIWKKYVVDEGFVTSDNLDPDYIYEDIIIQDSLLGLHVSRWDTLGHHLWKLVHRPTPAFYDLFTVAHSGLERNVIDTSQPLHEQLFFTAYPSMSTAPHTLRAMMSYVQRVEAIAAKSDESLNGFATHRQLMIMHYLSRVFRQSASWKHRRAVSNLRVNLSTQ